MRTPNLKKNDSKIKQEATSNNIVTTKHMITNVQQHTMIKKNRINHTNADTMKSVSNEFQRKQRSTYLQPLFLQGEWNRRRE